MKRIKKPISLLLTVLMVFSVFAAVPFSASAAVGDVLSESEYLTFTAEEAGSSVTLNVSTGSNLQYDLNGTGLTGYTAGTPITLQNVGDYVRFSGKDTTFNYSNHFSLTGKVACSGNVMSLRLDDNGRDQGLTDRCFQYMFYNCIGLTTAPELPETELADRCYYGMFQGCENLTKAPDLPATALANNCYGYMFSGCKSLTELPELPATNLAYGCYSYMFSGCTSLTTAPELPATTLAGNCYRNMFYGCTSLTTAPELPATSLESNCYFYMFYGCTSLTKAPELPATNLADSCYSNMFNGCTSLTELPALPATTLAASCYNYMFNNCSKICISDEAGTFGDITYSAEYRIPTTGEGSSAYNALYNMFYNTGGKFTGTPDINTTYYVPAPAPTGYTVTWKNWNGDVLETDNDVAAGTTPTYDGATPTRPSDSTNNYYFTGWEPTVDAITGDTTYTATYRSQKQLVINKGNYIRMGAYKDYYVDWFCALQNGTGSLMLTDCALRDMVFGSNSTYKTSNVHNWLDTKTNGVCDFATDLGLSQAEMDLARALNLSYGDGSEKFIIPSFEELKGTTYTKAKVIYDQNTTAFAYWLRTYRTSGGKKDNSNERVVRSQYSKVDERYRGVSYDAYVRPMFYLDTGKIKTMPYTGTGTKADPYVFETRQEVAKNVTILGSGATGGGDVTATATRSDITQRTDQKLYSSTLPNKLLTNSEVTVTAKPSAGYEFVSMEVLDADNHQLAYTEDPENPTAKFTLSGNVTVNAVFKKVNTITFYSDTEGTKVWKTVKRTAYESISDMEPTVDNQGNWTGEYQLSAQNNELFTFGGWATKSGITVWKDDKAHTDAPPDAFDWSQNMPDHDVELYPVWVANYINVRLDLGAYDAVAVADVAAGRNNWYDASRYDANTPASMGSPTFGDSNYQSRSFWKSTNITASTPDKDKYIDMAIMNAAERAGYTLDGWYNSSGMKWEPTYLISREYGDKDANGELKLSYDAPYRNFTYSITLTAKWNLNDAKVTYDVGEGSGDFTDENSYQLGDIITIPSNPPTPPADTDVLEYVFRGWMDAKGDLHLPGERFAFSEEALISTHGNPNNEIELTAKYQEIPIGTLAFLSQGGSLIDPIKSEEDTTVDLTPYVPTRSGYTFDGWYGEPACTTPVGNSIDITVGVSKRVYAKWTAENHNLFFYFFNGGSLFETITKAYNTDVTAPADPTRTGYTFKGWDKTIPLLMPAQDMTFYGTWDINTWKVIYQLYDDVTNEVVQSYGETVVEPAKPTREGYTFERWVDTNDDEKTFPFIMPDQNVTLTAKWKQNQAAPTNLTVTEASSDVSNDGKIEGVDDTMEYSLDGGETWISVPAGETEISGLAPGTVQIRYKATEDKNPSPAAEVEVKVQAKFFVGHSISLDGDITLNFFIDPQAKGVDFNNYSKAIVTFTWDEGQGQQYGTKSVNLLDPEEKNVFFDSATGRYRVSCNVAAAHMGYEVFAELYLNGEAEPIETDAYSVREYAEEIFDHPTDYVENGDPVKAEKLKKLVKAMLNYGATAQLAFIDDLADDSVELANSYVGENGYKGVTSGNIAAAIHGSASDLDAVASQLGAKYYTTSLLYLSQNKLRVYFTPTTYPGQIPNSGGFTGNKSGYYYYMESDSIAAAKLDEQQTLKVNGVTFNVSALDYAKVIVENKNEQMKEAQINLAKALFLYNQAANAYF